MRHCPPIPREFATPIAGYPRAVPIRREQIEEAQEVQFTAAHDASAQVRVVADPGTRKSSMIEERVRNLLAQGVEPGSLCVVSFTRSGTWRPALRFAPLRTVPTAFPSTQEGVIGIAGSDMRPLRKLVRLAVVAFPA